MHTIKLGMILSAFLCLTACGGSLEPLDYTTMRDQDPHSILVVPVVNNSSEADAADYFLTTLPIPLAERGFYVFPTNMVKRTMEYDGLGDAGMVHQADPTRVAELFNADSVLFVEITKWDSSYVILASNVTVAFKYRLVDGASGALLWQSENELTLSRSGNSGNILADLIVNAVTAAIDSVRSDYTNVARQANAYAFLTEGRGLPSGPYSPQYLQDLKAFPKTGSNWVGEGPAPSEASEE